jgi:hypothetical protein
MKSLALTKNTEILLPKMGIMTNLVELSRHDYIYIKDALKINEKLSLEQDSTRFWNKDALAVFYKGFKLGYLNVSISKMVNKLINRFGGVEVSIKSIPKNSNPFEGMDIIIQIL